MSSNTPGTMSMPDAPGILPADWPTAPRVRAVTTLRTGGVSTAPFDTLNLGDHVTDDAAAVRSNRARLRAHLALPGEPLWLNQVHGTRVVDAATAAPGETADGSFARQAGVVCAVLTADCLPVFLCDRAATCVAVVHAGWRGLAAGVIEQGLAAMGAPAREVLAWLGPAIGPQAFEVGGEVRQVFVDQQPAAHSAFRANASGRFFADLYALARLRLAAAGVTAVHGGGACTYREGQRYFSYRRDGVTGRMASLIWLQP
jgi:hypothetical protein